MEQKTWVIAAIVAIFALIVLGCTGANKANQTTGGETQTPVTTPPVTTTPEQNAALDAAKVDCDNQCQYEKTHALNFGATKGTMDGYPRDKSPWCSTTFNIQGSTENCYQLGFSCAVVDANKDTCNLMCEGTTAKCI